MRFKSGHKKISKHLRPTLTAGALMLCSYAGFSQTAPYKFDLGVDLGMSGYIGEANSSNIFKHPGFDGQVNFRYIGDARWGIKTLFSTLSLSGNSADMTNVPANDTYYKFSTQVYDLEVRGEFNFFAYGIGETYKRLRRWSPYITVGVGAALASTAGKTYVAPVIPMGMGIRYKIAERWNIGMEFTMTKAFNDNFDGPELSNLNLIKTAFYKNTDWYSRLTAGISYEFGKRCETCHYVD